MTLGLDAAYEADGPETAAAAPTMGDRLVEVAVDAAGAGGARPYTYRVPPALADLEAGEAVLVEFGRRQALGVILGDATAAPDAATKPIVDRVRAAGPLLPPLTLGLARWVAAHYLAPPALVIRSMLPPGLLERLELVAEATPLAEATPSAVMETSAVLPDPAARLDTVDADLLDQLAGGARPARDLAAPEGRAGLLRRLRTLAAAGHVTLDWTLLGASSGPRYERWLRATSAGRAVAVTLDRGERPVGRPLGPRQVAALADLVTAPADGLAAPELAVDHGASALAGLVRRGLVEEDVRERPRRPLARRP
ncbi:MAG: hypothetical protein ABIQ58_06055, partial [Candidatus Limnocylindrales bacterium]